MTYKPGFEHTTFDTTGATIPPLGLGKEQKALYKFAIVGSRRGRQLESRYSGAYKYGQAVADGDNYFNLMKAKSEDSLYPFKNPSMDNLAAIKPKLEDYINKTNSIIGHNESLYNPASPPNPNSLIHPSIISFGSSIGPSQLVEKTEVSLQQCKHL